MESKKNRLEGGDQFIVAVVAQLRMASSLPEVYCHAHLRLIVPLQQIPKGSLHLRVRDLDLGFALLLLRMVEMPR